MKGLFYPLFSTNFKISANFLPEISPKVITVKENGKKMFASEMNLEVQQNLWRRTSLIGFLTEAVDGLFL